MIEIGAKISGDHNGRNSYTGYMVEVTAWPMAETNTMTAMAPGRNNRNGV